MGKVLPVVLALIGLGGGVGAGYVLRPPPEDPVAINPCGADDKAASAHADSDAHSTHQEDEADGTTPFEYVKLNNQFVVPVVDGNDVIALVILSISLEVTVGATEQVFQREPRLRDQFLQILFDHANSGGFLGTFTASNNMEVLRGALLEVARKTLGATVRDVLIIDIVRQDT